MSNKQKFENLIKSKGYTLGLYEMTLSVFGTFYSGSVIDSNNKIIHDFKGIGFEEAYSDLDLFLKG